MKETSEIIISLNWEGNHLQLEDNQSSFKFVNRYI